MAEEQSGFLGRWARRKTDVLQGKVVEEPAAVAKPVWPAKVVLPEPVTNQINPVAPEANTEANPEANTEAAPEPEPPALSLEDVKLLTKDSDFQPFMAKNVGADVRNAAMKKLFADPHFNIMDGLDIYIDDYSKPDPIPEAMLRAMTSSKFLKLFDDKEDKDENEDKSKDKNEDALPRENANNTPDQTVAQSSDDKNTAEQAAVAQINSSQPELLPDSLDSQEKHDNPHLRLQPNHAAPAPKAGLST